MRLMYILVALVIFFLLLMVWWYFSSQRRIPPEDTEFFISFIKDKNYRIRGEGQFTYLKKTKQLKYEISIKSQIKDKYSIEIHSGYINQEGPKILILPTSKGSIKFPHEHLQSLLSNHTYLEIIYENGERARGQIIHPFL